MKKKKQTQNTNKKPKNPQPKKPQNQINKKTLK